VDDEDAKDIKRALIPCTCCRNREEQSEKALTAGALQGFGEQQFLYFNHV
jgi:hypothetical protein